MSIDSYLKYSEQLVNLNKDYYDKDYEKDNGITTDDMNTAETAAKAATKPTKPADQMVILILMRIKNIRMH